MRKVSGSLGEGKGFPTHGSVNAHALGQSGGGQRGQGDESGEDLHCATR
jgi:hypothetical protein